MCSGSEAGWYLRLIDFVCHSTLSFRVIKKKKNLYWGSLGAGGAGGLPTEGALGAQGVMRNRKRGW